MKPPKHLASACKYCRHYQPEGRRGGMCQQLGALVQAGWKACSLALPAFAPSWETLEDAWSLPAATPVLSNTSKCDLDYITLVPVEEITTQSPSISLVPVEEITTKSPSISLVPVEEITAKSPSEVNSQTVLI